MNNCLSLLIGTSRFISSDHITIINRRDYVSLKMFDSLQNKLQSSFLKTVSRKRTWLFIIVFKLIAYAIHLYDLKIFYNPMIVDH